MFIEWSALSHGCSRNVSRVVWIFVVILGVVCLEFSNLLCVSKTKGCRLWCQQLSWTELSFVKQTEQTNCVLLLPCVFSLCAVQCRPLRDLGWESWSGVRCGWFPKDSGSRNKTEPCFIPSIFLLRVDCTLRVFFACNAVYDKRFEIFHKFLLISWLFPKPCSLRAVLPLLDLGNVQCLHLSLRGWQVFGLHFNLWNSGGPCT